MFFKTFNHGKYRETDLSHAALAVEEPALTEQVQLANGWKYTASRVRETLPSKAVDEARQLIERWAPLFPKAKTWVGKEFGVPSLMIRLEGVYSHECGWSICEIEDRPCGIGATQPINPFFAANIEALRKQWPEFRWVIDPERNTDDSLWLGKGLTLQEALDYDGLLLVRSRPEAKEYHVLEPRAVSTVSQEGNKRPLAEMGLAKVVRWIDDPGEIGGGYIEPPVNGSFVIKPVQGTRCRDISMHLGGAEMRKLSGNKVPHINGKPVQKLKGDAVGFSGIEAAVRRLRLALCQPFFSPMHLDHQPNLNAIYRLFWGFSPELGRYIPLGGVWNATPSLRVHGDDTAVIGPLDFE